MRKYYAYAEDITERDGFVIEQFRSEKWARAFCEVHKEFVYFETSDYEYDALQDREDKIRSSVREYLERKKKHIEM